MGRNGSDNSGPPIGPPAVNQFYVFANGSSLPKIYDPKLATAQYLPFAIVFGSVILLFLGLCIYVVCVCPSFMRDLQIETKSPESDDDDEDSGTMTTDLTSGAITNSSRYEDESVELRPL